VPLSPSINTVAVDGETSFDGFEHFHGLAFWDNVSKLCVTHNIMGLFSLTILYITAAFLRQYSCLLSNGFSAILLLSA
jgi:hypothetical protein